MLTRRANIVRLESGAFTVQSMPSAPMYTVEYKTEQAVKVKINFDNLFMMELENTRWLCTSASTLPNVVYFLLW